MSNIETFKSLLETGNDNALLRYSLGNEYFKTENFEQAIFHLEKAIELNRNYSAAWKLYAKALTENQQAAEAINAYENGIEIAERNGDMQIVKEMRVFLKRLKKN
ncbi:MAG: tetratricopeptide repeat protein [Proteobacteria bacterium]|nr:tetratricopeptide repeat protein [Pseudomonadota bacterium]NOG60220.1 tetratricopeptide repeat protein [Pseudomonadota bacterium]